MDTHGKHESNLSLIDAVETLSHIADLEYDQEIGITEAHDLEFGDETFTYRTVRWLHPQGAELTLSVVKDVFRTILNYLKNYYENDYSYVTNPQTIEGIKTIMVLVGEAGKKLDKYTHLFHHAQSKSVTQLREYKQLQEFYLSRIARKIDEGQLGKWIMALSQRTLGQKKAPTVPSTVRKAMQTKHIYVDLESVKRDTEYELFFLRKEDGSRFFSPRLVRNIKLISDFGDYFTERKGDDPLVDVKTWTDRCMNYASKNILNYLGETLDRFYRDEAQLKDQELVGIMNKCYMALMMAANPENLMRNEPVKSCTEYFIDFQTFLREALHCREYQKMLAYPPGKENKLSQWLLDIVHHTCCGLFAHSQGFNEVAAVIQGLLIEANQDHSEEHAKEAQSSKMLWSHLAGDYHAMTKLMKRHANGPVMKLLNTLEDGSYQFYDPIWQLNLPSQNYTINIGDDRILNVRLPTPTYQEFINKCFVTEEFKGFLRSLGSSHNLNKFVIFNFQDRTSWKEHHRCAALEDLQHQQDFGKHLHVITMPKDTEFYHQLAPYHEDHRTDVFIEHFKEHLMDATSGFSFPKQIQNTGIDIFLDDVIQGVHKVFFNAKNVLTREQRMDFIELVYSFLELKILDILKPDAFAFMCKDGIDVGSISSTQFYAFLKLMGSETISDQDRQHIDTMLYAPALLWRERVVLPERFTRMINVLKVIENARNDWGVKDFVKTIRETFGDLYESPVFEAGVAPIGLRE